MEKAMDRVCRKNAEVLLLLAGCQGGAIYAFNLSTASFQSSNFDASNVTEGWFSGEKPYLHGRTRKCPSWKWIESKIRHCIRTDRSHFVCMVGLGSSLWPPRYPQKAGCFSNAHIRSRIGSWMWLHYCQDCCIVPLGTPFTAGTHSARIWGALGFMTRGMILWEGASKNTLVSRKLLHAILMVMTLKRSFALQKVHAHHSPQSGRLRGLP
jgi:hypothetical protein